jgi:plastocyanin
VKRLLMLTAAALVLLLPASSSAATVSVKIVPGGAFSPAKATVDSGDTVEWTNNTAVNRQIVADEGNFASSTLKPGQSYSFTFRAAGTYAYHDGLHPAVKGSVTVQGPPPAVTLDLGAPIVTYGNSTTLTGKISTGDSGETVTITSRPEGASAQQAATVTTGSGGSFSATVKPTIQTDYTATWKSTQSQTASVQVRPRVRLTHYTATKLFTRATSSISYEGHIVYLQRLTGVGWITVKRLTLGPNSGRIFKAPHIRGYRTYRVVLTASQAGNGYMNSWSNAARVRYRR